MWRDLQGKKRFFVVVLATLMTAFLFQFALFWFVRWWGGWLMGRCSHDDEVAGIPYVVKAYFTPTWSIRQKQRAHPGLSNFESCRPPHPHGQQQGCWKMGRQARRYSPRLVYTPHPTQAAPKSNPFLLVMYWDCNHTHLLIPPKPYTYHHRAAPRSGNVPAGGLHVRHDDLPAPPAEVQRPCRMAPQRPSQQQHLEKSSRQRG